MKTRQVFSLSTVFMVILLIVFTLSLSIVQGAASASADIPEERDQDLRSIGFTTCDAVSDMQTAECVALVALYEATGETNWTNHNFWKISDTPCSWYGVTCESGHVGFLDLHNNNLVGPLPAELGNLFWVHEMNLSSNSLNGNIPSLLGRLEGMTTLNLSDNQLTGAIPTDLGSMSSLRFLYLDHNQLSEAIPTSIGNLSNLITLDLGYNQLSGGIPAHLGLLSNLVYLTLNNNPLGGGIPSELGSLTNLLQFSLREDQLTGNVPAWLGSLSNLMMIELNDNQLEGEIPSELEDLSELTVLYLHGNQLTGSIPTSLGGLEKLSNLDLSSNQLTGTIPSEFGDLSQLQVLNLNSNQLSGSIPASLGGLSDLWQLALNNNQLTGSIPSELGQLSKLTTLSLSDNQISGNLPAELGDLTILSEVYLDHTQLSGVLPLSLVGWANIIAFYYADTNLCAPTETTFQTWLAAIPHKTITWNCLAAPTKTSPMNNAFTKDTTPTFTWQKQMDGEKYQIMVDDNSDFSSPVFNTYGLVSPYKTFTTALAQGAFYWKVRAKDPGGNWSPWSIKWKFTVDTTKPGKPILLSPLNDSKTSDSTPTFTWKAVTGAKYYQLLVDDNADFSSPVYTSPWGTTVSKTLGTALAPKLYYWKVRAKDAAGNIGVWSGAWKLTIK